MAINKEMTVEVVYANTSGQQLISFQIKEGATIESAILASGLLSLFPEIDLTKHKIGVFSKLRALSDEVKAGDRIEIYRPLTIDPMEARRIKAKKSGPLHNGSRSKRRS